MTSRWTLSTVRDAGMVEQRPGEAGVLAPAARPQAQTPTPRDPRTGPADQLVHHGAPARRLRLQQRRGKHRAGLEHNQPNHFAILELLQPTRALGADFVAVEWRELTVAPGAEWATKQRWTLKG